MIVRMDTMSVVSHKPPRGFMVMHPRQACTPSSPLGSRQTPFPESGSCPGGLEWHSGISVKIEAQIRGMDAESSDSSPDLGLFSRMEMDLFASQ